MHPPYQAYKNSIQQTVGNHENTTSNLMQAKQTQIYMNCHSLDKVKHTYFDASHPSKLFCSHKYIWKIIPNTDHTGPSFSPIPSLRQTAIELI